MTSIRDAVERSRSSIMPQPRCHSCGYIVLLDNFTYWNYTGRLTCSHCTGIMFIRVEKGELKDTEPLPESKHILHARSEIPESVRSDYTEALICLLAQAWKASAVMTRCTIQGALLIKGIPDQQPMKMVNDAYHKHGLLSESQHRMASTVTFFGGRGAHPQEQLINEVGELQASSGLAITKVLLEALWPPQPGGRLPMAPMRALG